MSDLRPEMFVPKLAAISAKAKNVRARPYSVYILRIEPVRGTGALEFYVGSTGVSVEDRFRKHVDPFGRTQRVSIFKDGPGKRDVYAPVEIMYALMTGFPTFGSRSSARRAERYLANALNARGHATYSDQIKKKKQSRRIDA